jgi:hypothetical protein
MRPYNLPSDGWKFNFVLLKNHYKIDNTCGKYEMAGGKYASGGIKGSMLNTLWMVIK